MKSFYKKFILFWLISTLLVGIAYAQGFDPLKGLGAGGGGNQPTPAEPQTTSATSLFNTTETPTTDMETLINGLPQNKPVQPTKTVEPAKIEPAKTTESTTEQPEDTDEFSLTIAECLIMEQLEIEDKKCDKLKQSLKCPEYTGCSQKCSVVKDSCFAQCNQGENSISCSKCRLEYDNCMSWCATDEPKCAEMYPPAKLKLPASSLQIFNASGDVKITYGNPQTSYLQKLEGDIEALVGVTIFTGNDGKLNLKFSDESEAFIGANANFRIDDFYTSEKLEKAIVYLKNGSVRVLVNSEKSKDKKYSYVVMTPLWKVKVKGTEFEINAAEDGSATLKTTSGAVEILDHEDDLIKTVAAGESYQADKDGKEITNTSDSNDKEIAADNNPPQPDYNYLYIGLAVLGGLVILSLLFWLMRRKNQ